MKNIQDGFKCINCGKWVDSEAIGTKNRNHCPFCLWSVHLDEKIGDRNSVCRGSMRPIGLTFKKAKVDKYGKERQGEIMIVHQCLRCMKIVKNRIAGDDNEKEILNVFEQSLVRPAEKRVKFLGETNREEVLRQLYGKG